MNLKIKIFNSDHLFNISNSNYELLLNLIEDKIKISKEFFDLKIGNKKLKNLEDIKDTNINLVWKVSCFEEDLVKLHVFDNQYQLPESIILESVVMKSILCDSDDEGNIKNFNNEDKLEFNTQHIDKKSINHWINLSCDIKNYLLEQDKDLSDIRIPKPLQTKKLYYYIGGQAYNYLDKLDFETIQKLATFTDFLDISYLLEIVCAFIAEKYVKNNSIDNIKKIFDNIEV